MIPKGSIRVPVGFKNMSTLISGNVGLCGTNSLALSLRARTRNFEVGDLNPKHGEFYQAEFE